MPLLFGAASVSGESGRRVAYNSAMLVGADGVIRDAYDKNLLIPFTEYVPFTDIAAPLGGLLADASRFTAASATPALSLGPWRISTPICYEAVRPAFVRRMVLAARPHLIVTLANDAWFGDSQEPWLHLAMAKLRAVEHRRYLVRATNSGVSAVIDPIGREVVRSGLLTRENLRATVHMLAERASTRAGATGSDGSVWRSCSSPSRLAGQERRRREASPEATCARTEVGIEGAREQTCSEVHQDVASSKTTAQLPARFSDTESNEGPNQMKRPGVFNVASEDDVLDLKRREIAENRFLDYKLELDPRGQSGKFELLKDVSAMANAEGGVLIYGVETDDNGVPADFRGLALSNLDGLKNTIDQVLGDNLDPPIFGIVHEPIRRADGAYFYVIRIPASPLAPHMITLPTTKPRFYRRANTVNAPMNATEIKELTLRHASMEERAMEFVRNRLARKVAFSGPGYIFNIVPLYGQSYSLDLSDRRITEKLLPLGKGNLYHSVDGFYVAWESERERDHVLFSRNGAVEFLCSRIGSKGSEGHPVIRGDYLEDRLLKSVGSVATADVLGLAEPPVLLHLRLHEMTGVSLIAKDAFRIPSTCDTDDVTPDPVVVYDWAEGLERGMKRLFDVVWQACGSQGSPNYEADGRRSSR